MTLPIDQKYAEIYKKRLSESLKGKKVSEETKRKQSKAKKNLDKAKKRVYRYNPEEYRKNRKKYAERQRRYRENPEKRKEYLRKAREQSKRWYRENKHKRFVYNKQWWKKYVASLEKEVGRKKPNKCEICNRRARICFDHDHITGKFRGWICHRCNAVLGLVYNDEKILESLRLYLKANVR